MSRPDLTYTECGMFVMFMAETDGGAEAWEALAAESDGTAKFLPGQVDGVISQLRAAGYSVRKAKPAPPVDYDDELLNELMK